MTTYTLAVILTAVLASLIIMACDGGTAHSSGSACANAAQQFEVAPSDATAQQARQACHMQ